MFKIIYDSRGNEIGIACGIDDIRPDEHSDDRNREFVIPEFLKRTPAVRERHTAPVIPFRPENSVTRKIKISDQEPEQ